MVFNENFILNLYKRLVEEDTGIHDKGSKRMIMAVLTSALVMDALLVIFRINPEIMFIYGLLLAGTLILAWRDYLVPARLVIPLGGLIMFGYLMWLNKGIRDVALLGLPLVIITSGLLYGKPGTLIYGLLSVFTLIFMGVAEVNGRLPSPILIQNTPTDYFAAGTAIVMVAVMQWLVIDRLNTNIKIAQQNEESQKRANKALQESEARYRMLIEESPEGILIIDSEGYILLANPIACSLLGYEESELIGKFAMDLIDPDDLSQHPVLVEELWTGEIVRREHRLVRKDGRPVIVMGSTRHMPDESFQYLFQDISKQKQAEAEREALIRELENKNAELERFTYTVSHDLKSPLVTIRGFLGYLERDVKMGDEARVRDDIRRIEKSTDQMNHLLMDLLELSRIGRLMNPPETVSFEAIVHEALELVQGRIRERDVKVNVHPNLPAVHGDRARLVEVLLNLIDNSVKFMGEQPSPLIEIGFRNDQLPPVFFVRDNGMGIPPEFHERVFGLFNRLNQDIEGTGVGLTLVKRIVEVHGGRVWIESGEGRLGVTFCFTLAKN
jgi:PAS domain S-box-containing protein